MSLFTSPIISAIASYFYEVDQRVRLDLSRDRLVGERDYLSRYVTLLEHPFGVRGVGTLPFRHLYIANNFPYAMEQRFGCDTFFIFSNQSDTKCLAIEGKYPRFHQRNFAWDYNLGGSHFSDQLTRQNILVSAGIPVLEMFINHDGPNVITNPLHSLDNLGSSFVTQQIAIAHPLRFVTWKQRDALAVVDGQFRSTRNVSIEYFITELLKCNIGRRRTVEKGDRELRIELPKEGSLNIPLVELSESGSAEPDLTAAIQFMKETGIRNLGFIQHNSDNVESKSE